MDEQLTVAQDLLQFHTVEEIDNFLIETNHESEARVDYTLYKYTFADGSWLWWSEITERYYATKEAALQAEQQAGKLAFPAGDKSER